MTRVCWRGALFHLLVHMLTCHTLYPSYYWADFDKTWADSFKHFQRHETKWHISCVSVLMEIRCLSYLLQLSSLSLYIHCPLFFVWHLFFRLFFRWTGLTIPLNPPVCDTRPMRLFAGGQEVTACPIPALFDHHVGSLVQTQRIFWKPWTIVGKLSFCPAPANRTEVTASGQIYQRVASGRCLLPTHHRLFMDLIWFLEYARHQEVLFSCFFKDPNIWRIMLFWWLLKVIYVFLAISDILSRVSKYCNAGLWSGKMMPVQTTHTILCHCVFSRVSRDYGGTEG